MMKRVTTYNAASETGSALAVQGRGHAVREQDPEAVTEQPPNLERAISDPVGCFDHPHQVIQRQDWTVNERRNVLEQWRLDAERLEDSANESMGGGEPSRLRAVLLALNELEKRAEAGSRTASRQHAAGDKTKNEVSIS